MLRGSLPLNTRPCKSPLVGHSRCKHHVQFTSNLYGIDPNPTKELTDKLVIQSFSYVKILTIDYVATDNLKVKGVIVNKTFSSFSVKNLFLYYLVS